MARYLVHVTIESYAKETAFSLNLFKKLISIHIDKIYYFVLRSLNQSKKFKTCLNLTKEAAVFADCDCSVSVFLHWSYSFLSNGSLRSALAYCRKRATFTINKTEYVPDVMLGNPLILFAGTEAFGIFCYLQFVDNLLNITVHNGRQIVQGQVDSVIGYTSLRIVVGADFRTAVTG